MTVARLAGRVPGVPQTRGLLWSQGQVRAGQLVSGSAQIRCQARAIASAHGQFAAIFQRLRRPPRTSRAAACRTRQRSILGSALARSPSRASSLSQASRICAIIAAVSHAWLNL